jgi:SAM-dependent methyltransferase
MQSSPAALTAAEYNAQWPQLDDFIQYNPGARHRRRLIRNAIQSLKFNSILDVGCGPGELYVTYADLFAGKRYMGLDLSDEVVATNRSRYPRATFAQLDISKARLDQTFDLIVATEVIEHIEDRATALANISAMLAPKGHLLLTFPLGEVFKTERYFGHVSHPEIEEIERLAAPHGLRIQKAKKWGWPTYLLQKRLTNRFYDHAMKNFASGNYSIVSKLICNLLYGANFFNFGFGSPCQAVVLLTKD